MNTGDYYAPQVRVAPVQFVAVGGYTTCRFRNLRVANLTPELNESSLFFENTGSAAVTLQLKETSSVSSGRNNVGVPFTLNPSGIKNVSFTPTKPILEVACTNGTSTVKAQMLSTLNWELMAFAKTDTLFPGSILVQSGNVLPWNQING